MRTRAKMRTPKILVCSMLAGVAIGTTSAPANACKWWFQNSPVNPINVNVYNHGGGALARPFVVPDFWGVYYDQANVTCVRVSPGVFNCSTDYFNADPVMSKATTMFASPFFWSRLQQYGVGQGGFGSARFNQTSLDNVLMQDSDIVAKLKTDIDNGLPFGHDPQSGLDIVDAIFLGPTVHRASNCGNPPCPDKTYWNKGYPGRFDYNGRHVVFALVEYSDLTTTDNLKDMGPLSHEVTEAITDPFTDSTGTPNGFKDDAWNEICDFANPELVPMSGIGTAQIWLQNQCRDDAAQTVGFYDPSNNTWAFNNSTQVSATFSGPAFGIPGDIPVTGDWDGDGTTTLGTYRPSTNQWFLDNHNDVHSIDLTLTFGVGPDDVPVTGDWDGDGITTIGIFRPSTKQWFLSNHNTNGCNNGSTACVDVPVFDFGQQPDDVPVAGDWDGTGATKAGIYRKSTNQWFLTKNNANTCNNGSSACVDIGPTSFGIPGDLPVPGDWAGQRKTTLGVFRPSANQWFFDNRNDVSNVDWTLSGFGSASVIPVAGRWTNQ